MRIKHLAAKNYRTLQDITIDFSPYYCTLSGKNNAGKSCVIQLIVHLFEPNRRPWQSEDYDLEYREDRTQWATNEDHIIVEWTILLSRNDDPALIAFIEAFSKQTISSDEVEIVVTITAESNTTKTVVCVEGTDLEDHPSREIVTKLKRSNCLFLHNSAEQQNHFFFAGPGRRKTFYEVYLSEEEQKMLSDASKAVQRKARQLAKGHRDTLSDLLGKLNEKYDVEFTTPEGFRSSEMMLGINLKDKKVEVPIDDWGSGTRNRTNILVSLLQAKRIKDLEGSEEKITPIVVVEEPESFLHPAAQAEFGGILQDLAQELGIQIIVSTHSPFMLNRVSPSSNILLRRRVRRQQLQETEVVDTTGENWMEPFSEHLGIVSPEFDHWRTLFFSRDSRVLLVEGKLDVQYFLLIRDILGDRSGVGNDVEIVEYGGKDALKNTVLVNFVLRNFKRVFITFDLDAAADVGKSLDRLGLKLGHDYLPIGKDEPGKAAVEGLLPDRVSSAVFGRETDLVMQMGSPKSDDRRAAKDRLKRLLLQEFRSHSNYTDKELKGFLDVGKVLKRAFG